MKLTFNTQTVSLDGTTPRAELDAESGDVTLHLTNGDSDHMAFLKGRPEVLRARLIELETAINRLGSRDRG